MITYQISLDDPRTHTIQVRLTITQPLKKGQGFWLPSWIPGSYMIRDFARNITQLEARENGQKVSVHKISSSRWQLEQPVKQLELVYSVYAWDLSVRSAHFDQHHCFFNGTSVFIAVEGLETESHHVDLVAAKDPSLNHWKVATAMRQLDTDESGFGRYLSQDYAELIDHPFEIADLVEVVFEVSKKY